MKSKKFLAVLTAATLGITGVQVAIADTVDIPQVFSQKITIKSNTDFKNDENMPLIAKEGMPILIKVDGAGKNDLDKIQIIGQYGVLDTGDTLVPYEKNSYDYKWIPSNGTAGIYTLRVTDKQGRTAERKIYVNNESVKSYYQLEGIGFKEITVQPQVTTGSAYEVTTGSAYNITPPEPYTIIDPNQAVFGTKLHSSNPDTNPELRLTVGEEGFWRRTIRTFRKGEVVNQGTYSIAEGTDFVLDKGTYNFWASTRAANSIESEDFMKSNYTRKDKEHIAKLELQQNGSTFTAVAKCLNEEGQENECELAYAFRQIDDLGPKLLQDYKLNSNSFNVGEKSHQYTIEARVKHGDNFRDNGVSYRLPNSYEAIETKTVMPATSEEYLEITEVEIDMYSLTKYYKDKTITADTPDDDLEKLEQQLTKDIKKAGYVGEVEIDIKNDVPSRRGKVLVNNKNYISIDVDAVELEEGESMSYKAWVVDHGVTIPLELYKGEKLYKSDDDDDEDYEDYEAKFVYYPKSGGDKGYAVPGLENKTQKLIVSAVKRNAVGEIIAQDSQEIILEVGNYPGE